MSGKNMVLMVFNLIVVVTASAYAAPAVEVSGDLKLSGTGTISFPDGSVQTTAGDCHGRYEDNGDGTVTDCRTGVIWLKNAKCTDTSGAITNTNGYLTWADANTWVAGLGKGLCGLTDGSSAGDWRLPTKTEWMAMVQSARKHGYIYPSLTNTAGTGQWAAGDIFDVIQSNCYWSSSTYAGNTGYAWFVNMYDGSVHSNNKTINYYVWPVRGGQ